LVESSSLDYRGSSGDMSSDSIGQARRSLTRSGGHLTVWAARRFEVSAPFSQDARRAMGHLVEEIECALEKLKEEA
jgi:hypothetical protein